MERLHRHFLSRFSARVLFQIGYWALYALLLAVLFFLLTLSQRPSMQFAHWCRIMAGFAVIPGVIGFYSSYAFLFPYYLRKKNVFNLITLAAAIALLASLAGMVWLTFVVSSAFLVNDGIYGAVGLGLPLAFIALVNGCIGFVIKGFESWFHDVKLREELNKRNYEMELALIKSQLDPHFLFNTINNIDILIEKNSAKASAYLNKLSDIMRFMLYETKNSRIPLAQELAYIEKYITLQMIRTSNDRALDYVVQGDPGLQTIEPMLFIPFIENAFKHTDLKVPNAITVRFVIDENKVVFECKNLLTGNRQPEMHPAGLGKKLIERRLTLLYPGKHHLFIRVDDQQYQVKLLLEICSPSLQC
ncbi:Histidine kinase [Dyadobacter soli]|uniref:Histidine kinase n=1 Tax=Dyadobacter soli TaxID=659014 RepID=A0A1G6VK33_9BACT|nr:sensor histidine kinase [Dyadobacter soli]SDD53919.1 Histidine kinase [Dyadobacter soli]